MSELENEIKSDKEFIEKVADRIYKDTDDWEEAIAEPEWIDRMTEIADRYIERFEVTRKLADKWLQSKQQPPLNENQQIVLEHLKKITIDRSFEYALWELIDDVFECDYDSVGSESWDRLDSFKKAQVTEVFAKWAQEMEDE